MSFTLDDIVENYIMYASDDELIKILTIIEEEIDERGI